MFLNKLKEIGREARIVLEPVRRDSGPAVAVGAELAAEIAPETIVAILAADHIVKDREGFVESCRRAAAAAARGYIVTLGIKPSEPATGYGYIKTGKAVVEDGTVLKVEAFVEKPDAAAAASYVAAGHLWNAGNFFFRADVMQEELRRLEPAILEAACRIAGASPPGSRLSPPRQGSFYPSPEDIHRLRRHGAYRQSRCRTGRHRLVGCRNLGSGMRTVATRQQRQFGARPRHHHERKERSRPIRRAPDNRHRRRQRRCRHDGGRRACSRQGAWRRGQAACRSPEERESPRSLGT